ncbi:MAG: hypothetical protein NTY98_17600 [Verrucomicrobia bacterium]|nr:hypothetical protein [Verrucomicrobiota bacterium]
MNTKKDAQRVLLKVALIATTLINVVVVAAAAWSRQSIGAAMDRYVAEFASRPVELAFIQPIQQVITPLIHILLIVSLVNLVVTAWFYRLYGKDHSQTA